MKHFCLSHRHFQHTNTYKLFYSSLISFHTYFGTYSLFCWKNFSFSSKKQLKFNTTTLKLNTLLNLLTNICSQIPTRSASHFMSVMNFSRDLLTWFMAVFVVIRYLLKKKKQNPVPFRRDDTSILPKIKNDRLETLSRLSKD